MQVLKSSPHRIGVARSAGARSHRLAKALAGAGAAVALVMAAPALASASVGSGPPTSAYHVCASRHAQGTSIDVLARVSALRLAFVRAYVRVNVAPGAAGLSGTVRLNGQAQVTGAIPGGTARWFAGPTVLALGAVRYVAGLVPSIGSRGAFSVEVWSTLPCLR